MISRCYAPIKVRLAFVLLCLLPAAMHARTHTPLKRRATSALPHSPKRAERPHPTLLKSHAKPVVHSRHTVKQVHQTVPLKTAAPRRSLVILPDPKPQIAAPLRINARPATETAETGVSHPPDLNDQDPSPDAQTPVVSLIRKTGEHPQLAPPDEVAATPEILPSLYNKRGRLVMPPALKGSHEILVHQNEVADRDGVQRVLDDSDLEEMRRRGQLVAVPVNAGLQVDERLPANRRYCRPWTAQFLATLARAHYAQFHSALQVNSAVRTVEVQQRLLRTNGNAAPVEGETASPHLTGQAVDLAKRGLSLSEIAWMRGYLLPLVQEGKIDVEEEFQQSCFHISVYKRYLPPGSVPRRNIATTHREGAGALAVAIQ